MKYDEALGCVAEVALVLAQVAETKEEKREALTVLKKAITFLNQTKTISSGNVYHVADPQVTSIIGYMLDDSINKCR